MNLSLTVASNSSETDQNSELESKECKDSTPCVASSDSEQEREAALKQWRTKQHRLKSNNAKHLVREIFRQEQKRIAEQQQRDQQENQPDKLAVEVSDNSSSSNGPVFHTLQSEGNSESDPFDYEENLSDDEDCKSWKKSQNGSEETPAEDSCDDWEVAILKQKDIQSRPETLQGDKPSARQGEKSENARMSRRQRAKLNDSNQSFSRADKKKRLVMNIAQTDYYVIKRAGRCILNFRLRRFNEDKDGAVVKGLGGQKLSPVWDLSWHDSGISADFLSKMALYQKVNMYPGIQQITRKNYLARNLCRMQKFYGSEYDFFPRTWVLPSEMLDLRAHSEQYRKSKSRKRHPPTYIVKPDAMSQGRGIFMSRNIERICRIALDSSENPNLSENPSGSVAPGEKLTYVAQHYIEKPHLIDDLKYDLRLYVLVCGVSPLRIYLHRFGMARFCTELYEKPVASNINNLFMHLTNYAINKTSDAYEDCEDEQGGDGHKRSLGAILNIIKFEEGNIKLLMSQIKDAIVKTIIPGQPHLAHLYRACQPDCLDNSMCFQILGFDFLIDHKFRPWLLEVNSSPSFRTDQALDYKVKKNVLADTFRLLNLNQKRRRKLVRQTEKGLKARMMTGKLQRMPQEEREALKQQKLKERFEFEAKNTGGYELIFPCSNEMRQTRYEEMLGKAKEIFDDFTTGKRRRVSNELETQQAKKPEKPVTRTAAKKTRPLQSYIANTKTTGIDFLDRKNPLNQSIDVQPEHSHETKLPHMADQSKATTHPYTVIDHSVNFNHVDAMSLQLLGSGSLRSSTSALKPNTADNKNLMKDNEIYDDHLPDFDSTSVQKRWEGFDSRESNFSRNEVCLPRLKSEKQQLFADALAAENLRVSTCNLGQDNHKKPPNDCLSQQGPILSPQKNEDDFRINRNHPGQDSWRKTIQKSPHRVTLSMSPIKMPPNAPNTEQRPSLVSKIAHDDFGRLQFSDFHLNNSSRDFTSVPQPIGTAIPTKSKAKQAFISHKNSSDEIQPNEKKQNQSYHDSYLTPANIISLTNQTISNKKISQRMKQNIKMQPSQLLGYNIPQATLPQIPRSNRLSNIVPKNAPSPRIQFHIRAERKIEDDSETQTSQMGQFPSPVPQKDLFHVMLKKEKDPPLALPAKRCGLPTTLPRKQGSQAIRNYQVSPLESQPKPTQQQQDPFKQLALLKKNQNPAAQALYYQFAIRSELHELPSEKKVFKLSKISEASSYITMRQARQISNKKRTNLYQLRQ